MLALPSKFTGIGADLLNFKEFQKLCYSLQGLGLCTVKRFTRYEYPNNYFSAALSSNGSNYELLQNCFVKCIGFKENLEGNVFIDRPELMTAITSIDEEMKVLDQRTLNQEVAKKQLKDLSKTEQKELQFWLPAKLGELLFCSYFD